MTTSQVAAMNPQALFLQTCDNAQDYREKTKDTADTKTLRAFSGVMALSGTASVVAGALLLAGATVATGGIALGVTLLVIGIVALVGALLAHLSAKSQSAMQTNYKNTLTQDNFEEFKKGLAQIAPKTPVAASVEATKPTVPAHTPESYNF